MAHDRMRSLYFLCSMALPPLSYLVPHSSRFSPQPRRCRLITGSLAACNDGRRASLTFPSRLGEWCAVCDRVVGGNERQAVSSLGLGLFRKRAYYRRLRPVQRQRRRVPRIPFPHERRSSHHRSPSHLYALRTPPPSPIFHE